MGRYSTRSRIEFESNDLQQVVNYVLLKYTGLNPYLKSSHSPPAQNTPAKVMKSEKVFISEENTDLWDRALKTSLDDINCNYYPHHTVVQKLINYTLNSNYLDIGLVTMFFSKLLFFHPHGPPCMQDYYWSILNDKCVALNNIESEEKNVFWCMVKVILSCLESGHSLKRTFCQEKKNDEEEMLQLVANLNRKTSSDLQNFLNFNRNSNICFDSLTINDKLHRALIVLNFLCDILDANFVNCEQQCGSPDKNVKRSFFSTLVWPYKSYAGVINEGVKALINLYRLIERMGNEKDRVHEKLMTLLAEAVRRIDMNFNSIYPYLGDSSDSLACEMALLFIEYANDTPAGITTPIQTLKPHWLRLLICCKVLTFISGKNCPPELTTVIDVLENVVDKKIKSSKIKTKTRSRERSSKRNAAQPSEENINPGNCFGGCKLKNNGKKGKRSSQADINATDDQGWAALHKAVLIGHYECVQELLNYRPGYGKRKKPVNTRLKGYMNFTPLMCAVMKNNPKICKIMLQLSGPGLLEDVDVRGRTPMDLCQSEEVRSVLESFTERKTGEKTEASSGNTDLMIDLCSLAVESYFMTHRTLDVVKCLKEGGSSVTQTNECDKLIRWKPGRYQGDIHDNISRLKATIAKFRSLNLKNNLSILDSVFKILDGT